jgi:hypothetical protein
MFPPGFFAADYFAPGYWPDASEATASNSMAATLSGSAQLVATGAVTARPVDAPQVFAGRFAIQRRSLPRSVPLFSPNYADAAATLSGAAMMRASGAGSAVAGGLCAGSSTLEAKGAMRRNFARQDNAFWLMAA